MFTRTDRSAHRKRQLEERLAWGEAYQDSGYLFTREDGTAIHPHSLSQFFEKRVARAGVGCENPSLWGAQTRSRL
jgi:hypothetical protein